MRLEPREGGERRGRIPQGQGSPGKELGLFPACNLLTLKPNNRITKCTIRSVFEEDLLSCPREQTPRGVRKEDPWEAMLVLPREVEGPGPGCVRRG